MPWLARVSAASEAFTGTVAGMAFRASCAVRLLASASWRSWFSNPFAQAMPAATTATTQGPRVRDWKRLPDFSFTDSQKESERQGLNGRSTILRRLQEQHQTHTQQM